MANIPCPHCGRSISDQSVRCLYCAKPLAGDTTAAEQRAKMLAAMYEGGVGLDRRQKSSAIERLRDEPLLVRLVAAVPILAVGLFWPPAAWKWMKELFRP